MKHFRHSRHRRHYRVDIISEDTFNRIWSLRMSRLRAWLVAIGAVAMVAGGVYLLLGFTPLRHYMPGYFGPDVRAGYLSTALKVDSIEEQNRINRAWIDNLRGILTDSLPTAEETGQVNDALSDSLMAASDAERDFLRRHEEEERFRLSVLSPIAAEGMVFHSPVESAARMRMTPTGALSVEAGRAIPVAAIYRGTVTSLMGAPDGTYTLVIQHPNDFLTVYQGLGDVYVERGTRVTASQRIGASHRNQPTTFELWHGGTLLDPREYIPF